MRIALAVSLKRLIFLSFSQPAEGYSRSGQYRCLTVLSLLHLLMKFCSINKPDKPKLVLKGLDYGRDQVSCQAEGHLLVPVVCMELVLASSARNCDLRLLD